MEMYIELMLSGFSVDEIPYIKKVKRNPGEIAIKGEEILTSEFRADKKNQIVEKNNKVRRWKETFLSFKYSSKYFDLDKDLKRVFKDMERFRKNSRTKAIALDVKCVVYFHNDRPNLSLKASTIKKLASFGSSLDLSVY